MTEKEFPCEICGRPTTGAWSEGGHKWAICERCMALKEAGLLDDDYEMIDLDHLRIK